MIPVIVREIRRIIFNPRYPIIITLGIVFMFVFFATLTEDGQPTRLSVAVVDMDGSYLSRRLCHEINTTQGVNVTAVYNNHTEARKALQRGKIFAFYEIPKGTYNDLLQFRAPHFVLYCNSAYMLAGTLSYKQLATLGMMAGGAVQREILRKKGYEEDQIMGLIQPVEYDTRMIGNPWIDYGNYLMTTLIPAVIAFLVVLHSAYTIARERQKKSIRIWMSKAKGNVLKALVGKMIPYTVWYSFLCILANLIMFGFMKFPLEGSWMLMVLNSILLVFASQCAGIFIGCCVTEAPLTMSIAALYSAMSFSLSGFSFPVESMPVFVQAFSNIYPIRHYFLNYSDIAIFGNGMYYCWSRYCALLAFGLMIIGGSLILRWQLKRFPSLFDSTNTPKPLAS